MHQLIDTTRPLLLLLDFVRRQVVFLMHFPFDGQFVTILFPSFHVYCLLYDPFTKGVIKLKRKRVETTKEGENE
jgi:hypothetical protein